MGATPRSDAVAWRIIELLPAHAIISAPVAAAVTERVMSEACEAIEGLIEAGALIALSDGRRYRWCEAGGLLNLIGQSETRDLNES